MSERLKALADAGVSIWLDDLSRERITVRQPGRAGRRTRPSVGVTTNPTIFAAALAKGEAYDAQIEELAARDVQVEDTIKALTTDDVRNACDMLRRHLRRHRRGRRPGLDRGRARAWPWTPTPPSRQAAGPVEDRRPARTC